MEEKSLNQKKLFLSFILILIVSWSVIGQACAAKTASISLSAWSTKPPTIDGKIQSSEWSDAHRVSFTLVSQVFEVHPATLWVKNDRNYLYMAVKVKGDDYNIRDGVFFYFDNNNDGYHSFGDEWLVVRPTDSWDGFLATPNPWMSDSSQGGTNDIVAAASHTNILGTGDYSFELRHPLDSEDNAHDFSLTTGDRIGVELEFDDAFVGGAYTSPWPSFDSFATIIIKGDKRIEQAVRWALDWADGLPYPKSGKHADVNYIGWCASFVMDAYEIGAHSKIRPGRFSSARDAWQSLSPLNHGEPPRGTFVFYDVLSGENAIYDHVGLSIGGGKIVHAWTSGPRIDEFDKNFGSYMEYIGWAFPPLKPPIE